LLQNADLQTKKADLLSAISDLFFAFADLRTRKADRISAMQTCFLEKQT
jgi:hypothetical protein